MKIILLLIFLSAILFLPQVSLAATIADCSQANILCVDDTAGPNQEYSTIQAAANVANPGDTILVFSGTYDERVTLVNSGSPGNFIIFEASGNVRVKGFTLTNRSYIKITGFEITNQGFSSDSASASIFMELSNNIQILNNHIHDTSTAYCIRMRDVDGPSKASNNNLIKNNIISNCNILTTNGAGIGINIFGNNNIVENNDISHLGNDFTRMTGGDFNVIRNNIFHDNSIEERPGSNAHIDGMQNWCSSSNGLAARHTLIENNYLYNAPSGDTHFVIFQDYGLCGNSEFLIRFNIVSNLGSYIQINDEKTTGVRVYNNSFSNTGVAYSPKPMGSLEFYDSSFGGKVINNIFHNAIRDGFSAYSADASSQTGFNARNNLVYNDGYGGSWASPIGAESGVVMSNPLFISSNDLHLQSISPAIDSGGHLTNVSISDTGFGATFVVNDAGFFQDGWSGINPDWIAVGTTSNAAQISSINYSTNTITLSSSISRNNGDPVWLYKDSNGRIVLMGSAWDIGAYEYI